VLAWLTVLALLTLTAAALAQQDELIDKLQQSYSNTKTFRAKFTQESTNKQTGLTSVVSGSVAFKKPGMMRWDYDEPHAKSMITDGYTLWIYLPAQKQVFMERFNRHYSSQLPVLFLSGGADLREQFEIQPGPAADDGVQAYTLNPKVPTPGFSQMTLLIDPQKMHVVGTIFIDAYGNTTKVGFSKIETDVPLPEGFFIFTPPADVEVITSPQ